MSIPLDLIDVSSAKKTQFSKKNIFTVEDLAWFFPRKYYNFTTPKLLKDVEIGETCAVRCTVYRKISGDRFFYAMTQDEYRNLLNVSWFNTSYFFDQIKEGESYYFCGKITSYNGSKTMTSPILFGKDKSILKIFPVYSKIQGMANNYLVDKISLALASLRGSAPFGKKEVFAKRLSLMSLPDALGEIHNPTSSDLFKKARTRVAFEKIYDFYYDLSRKSNDGQKTSFVDIKQESAFLSVKNSLPFPLTVGQQESLQSIMKNMGNKKRVNALISGDVGCGKTIVAILLSVLLWENGYQTSIMAPTLVLAKQHYSEFIKYVSSLGLSVALLTSETKKRERTKILKDLAAGDINILVGTHSVLSDEIEFNNLGLIIVDEEHKFGVEQKECLIKNEQDGVHYVAMTATPIPRSLAMTVYGNGTDVLPIYSMPANRKPVITTRIEEHEEIFDKLFEQVSIGRQCYVICPFIEDSSSERFQGVDSVKTIQEEMQRYYSTTNRASVRIGVISGSMKQKDILETIDQFAKGDLNILISTSIVEVGVNVPNATAIAVMSAERFGLSALHQLRGRVGRGSEQSYCYLCSAWNEKMDVLCSTSNGFEIAEKDLVLRGPGDLVGASQTGSSEVINLILKRPKLSAIVKNHFFQ